MQRQRHPGHLDTESTYAEVLGLHALESLGPLEVGPCVKVDTSREPSLDAIVRDIQNAFSQSQK